MKEINKSTNTRVFFSKESNTISIKWKGVISMKEFENGLTMLQKQAYRINDYNVVFDFGEMKQIIAEARVWFQDEYMPQQGVDFLLKANKLAVVKPSEVIAGFIVENFLKTINESCPQLNYQLFGNLRKANKWMGVDQKPVKSKSLSIASMMSKSFKLRLT